MPKYHAVVWTDHSRAEIHEFDAAQVEAHRVRAHSHPTTQHGSGVRSQHEFYASLCEALAGVEQVLLTGSRTALADFRHYVDKHRPALATHIVGWETVDQPTAPQLVALARRFFRAYDQMAEQPRG